MPSFRCDSGHTAKIFSKDMTEKELRTELSTIEALKGKSMLDICELPEMLSNIDALLRQQRELRQAARDTIKKPGSRLYAHTVDKFMETDAEDMLVEYLDVIAGVSTRPAAERKYINEIGARAYRATVAQIAIAERPELKGRIFDAKEN